MKKIVLIAAGLFVLVLGAGVALPHMVDWNKYKPRIQAAIEDATGYEVSLGGNIDLAILPFPHVVIENLAVRGVESADIVTLKKAEASLALAPLFSGEVNVSSVNLVEPVITLDVARDGRQMWMTETLENLSEKPSSSAAESAAAPAADGKFALKELKIENGTLRYSDARTGETVLVEKINAVLSADSLTGPFKANGDMVWDGQMIDADIQSGRLDKVAKTIAVQAELAMPESGALVHYNGLIGTAGGLDLQGETRVETKNISSTLTALSGTASTLPPLPLTVQGLLTAKADKADIKTLKVTVGDVEANGAVGIQNLQAKDGPMLVVLDLKTASPVVVENFLPGKSVKTVKGAADKDVPKTGVTKTLLPETLQLPVPVDLKAALEMASVSYKGAVFGNVKIGVDKKGGMIAVTEDIGQMPGGGQLKARSDLAYASNSAGEKAGIIYSDPTLSFEMNGDSTAPGKLLSAFLPEATVKSMQPLFKDPVRIAASGTVRPTKASVNKGSFSLGKTVLNLGPSSYTLDPNGKDDVVVSVSGQDINLDYFIGNKPQPTTQDKVQTVTAPKKPMADIVQDTLKKLDLPVDLTIEADLQNITMQGTTYGALNIDGALTGNMLNIETASLQDPEGDVMQIAGTIKELDSLTGVDLVLSGKTSDAIAFLSSFKIDTSKLPKDFGPLDLAIDVAGETPKSLAFAARAKALEGEGQANGLLVNVLSDKPAVDQLSLRVTHPNFEKLMQRFNPGYNAGVGIKKDMDVFANINLEQDGYSLSGLNATIGGMTMTGTINANMTGDKPDIKATLNAGTIPLDILSGKNKTGKTSATAPKATNSKTAVNDVRWSREAIDTAWMRDFNLDLKLNAEAVEYGNWVLSNTVLAAALRDGVLTIGQMDAGVYGGTMGLTATVKSAAQDRAPIDFNVATSFKNVALEPLVSSFSGAQVIKARGNVSLDLEAQSSGISPVALISALRGQGNVNGENVVIEGFDLAAMSRALVSTTKVIDNITGLADASLSGGETAFETVSGPFTIAEGVINFDNFKMEGPTADITNKGQISLPRWVIDMNSNIDLATPEDAPNLDIRFQGPLDNPGNTFAGQAMESYVQTRINQKLQKVIGEELGDKNPELNNLLNSVLGGGAAPKAPTPAPAPAPTSPAAPQAAPPVLEEQISPSAGEATTAPVPQKEMSPEEQIMRGVLEGVLGD